MFAVNKAKSLVDLSKKRAFKEKMKKTKSSIKDAVSQGRDSISVSLPDAKYREPFRVYFSNLGYCLEELSGLYEGLVEISWLGAK